MFHSKVVLLTSSSFVLMLSTLAYPSYAQNKLINPGQINNWTGQIVVGKVEKKIGHRLDWKRRQQLVTKAKIMSDTIDKSNKEFAMQIQRAFHLGSSEVNSLHSRVVPGRMYGSEALVKRRISLSRKRPLTKFEEKQISSLVSQRDSIQKKAREKMAYEIQGTIGIPYSEALSMVAPRRSRSELQKNSGRRNSVWKDLSRQQSK